MNAAANLVLDFLLGVFILPQPLAENPVRQASGFVSLLVEGLHSRKLRPRKTRTPSEPNVPRPQSGRALDRHEGGLGERERRGNAALWGVA